MILSKGAVGCFLDVGLPLRCFSAMWLSRVRQQPPQAEKKTPSALESDSKGWTDLIAETGPDLKGWTTVSVPPGKQSSPSAKWSLRPTSRVITCKGDGGHEWLRRTRNSAISSPTWSGCGFPIPESGQGGATNSNIVRASADGTIWRQGASRERAGGIPVRQHAGQRPTQNGGYLLSTIKDRRVKPAGSRIA